MSKQKNGLVHEIFQCFVKSEQFTLKEVYEAVPDKLHYPCFHYTQTDFIEKARCLRPDVKRNKALGAETFMSGAIEVVHEYVEKIVKEWNIWALPECSLALHRETLYQQARANMQREFPADLQGMKQVIRELSDCLDVYWEDDEDMKPPFYRLSNQSRIKELKKLVEHVNLTEVSDEDRLSDHVYRYNYRTKEFIIAA